MSKNAPGVRYAEVERETNETTVRVVLDLDGGSRQDISTGIGFFDHMLTLMAFHGCFDIGIKAEGDLVIDDHHTVEDVGIVFGRAVKEALGDDPILRYGETHSVMDEALVLVAMDISGRGSLTFDCDFGREYLGEMSTECVAEFFRAFARHTGMGLHIRKLSGSNAHHVCEAMFKGFGRALHSATRRSDRRAPSSTKGKAD